MTSTPRRSHAAQVAQVAQELGVAGDYPYSPLGARYLWYSPSLLVVEQSLVLLDSFLSSRVSLFDISPGWVGQAWAARHFHLLWRLALGIPIHALRSGEVRGGGGDESTSTSRERENVEHGTSRNVGQRQ